MQEPSSDLPAATRHFAVHDRRGDLLGEFHARPFRLVTAPRLFLHYAFAVPQEKRDERADMAELCRRQGVAPPGPSQRHHVLDFGNGVLRWEWHAEFVTYTWDGPLTEGRPDFPAMPSTHPFGEAFEPPGPMLVAMRLDVIRDGGDMAAIATQFDAVSLCVADVYGGAATIISDFRQDGDGRSRILVLDHHLTAQQTGSLAQRLVEIETYRTLAMLGLDDARRIGPEIRQVERDLVALAERIRHDAGLAANRDLLAEISRLTADVEAIGSATSYRFGASRAYDDIVRDRLAALHETHRPGYGTWTNFLMRRLEPAMRTVAATERRQQDLSDKLGRAAQLLRTRVEIELEQQNGAVLETMNRRARQQLLLQQTVEGLSIAAVSYYVVGLVGYLVKGAKEAHLLDVDPAVATAVAVPIVVAVMALIVRRIRRAHAVDH